MKKFTAVAFSLLLTCGISAQIDSDFDAFRKRMQSEFADFQNKAQRDYNEFRRKANEDFARFMEQQWEQMHVMKGEQPTERPKPVRQPVAVPDRILPTQPEPMPEPDVVPMPEKVPPPEIDPDELIEELPQPVPSAPTEGMMFYGTNCPLHIEKDKRIVLKSTNEKSAANAWKELSDGRYDALLRDCLSLRSSMQLGDWGYIELTRQAAIATMDKEGNEATLLQGWLLSQAGIEIRIARANNKFVLMVPFDIDICSYSYINIKGRKYYILDNERSGNLAVCNMAFPKSHSASIKMQKIPQFAMSQNATRNFEASNFSTMKASVYVNKNLMRFFDGYPHSNSYIHLVYASLSDEVKKQLYPALRQQLDGKSKKKQVQMLLDFVQTSFDYKSDKEQFGSQRAFFGDESFYHPFNDCEDRSILFSILVRELVGLDVILLDLPNHMAAAVNFDTEMPGNYYTVGGKHFTVCDPTYIGAGIGEAMPQFQNVKARVIRL